MILVDAILRVFLGQFKSYDVVQDETHLVAGIGDDLSLQETVISLED